MSDHRDFDRALITGIGGSAGSYLAEYIVSKHPGVEVHGISRWHGFSSDNLKAVQDKVTVHEADLLDFGSVLSVLEEVQPDAVFHLAAHANVRASFLTPSAVLTNNIVGTSNLFEAIRLARLDPVIKLCSTSEVYGQVDPLHVPIKEDAPLRPASPYAVSKATQDMLGWTYFNSYNMSIIRTRMFGYLNNRRTDLFATSFARQVAWIERGLQKELVHGNLDSVRTLIDVRDAVRAYWLAIEKCQPGQVYNIGGTTPVKVGDYLDRLVEMSEVPIPTRSDPNLLRPADVTLQIPCVDKFVDETSWQPAYTLEESVVDMLAHWRRAADIELERRERIG
jgi:GDP-mannose 4,6-dehydratase